MHRLRDLFDMPPVWLAVFAALAWALSGLTPAIDAAWPIWLGRLLIALGLGIMLAAFWAFLRRRTTLIPRRPPSGLVDGGVYRWSRNPIYVGDLLVLAGLAVGWQSWLGLLLVPALGAVLEWRFIRREEPILAATLGQPYREYQARVRRWV
jgi:protein-S-isoprenylcysteine O-methyltransferase Ste14